MLNEKTATWNAFQYRNLQAGVATLSDEELLDVYLALPLKQRNGRFADTACASEIAGVSQRTIQLWIEGGSLRAVRIGKKYQVSLDSLRAYLRAQGQK